MSGFFNTPKVATTEDCELRWSCGKPGEFFRCALCGHKFVPGDHYQLVYTNDIPGAGGNPICCTSHGSPEDVRPQWVKRCAEFKEFAADKFWFFHKRGNES